MSGAGAVHIVSPLQTILISCRGSVNIFGKVHHLDEIYPSEWHTPVSNKQMIYAVVIPKSHHICEIVKTSKVFAVNFVSFESKDSVVRIRKHSGDIIDKFLLAGFTSVECEKIDCCRIQESAGFLECEVQQMIDSLDSIIFLAKVVNAEVNQNCKRLFYLGGDEYTTTIK